MPSLRYTLESRQVEAPALSVVETWPCSRIVSLKYMTAPLLPATVLYERLLVLSQPSIPCSAVLHSVRRQLVRVYDLAYWIAIIVEPYVCADRSLLVRCQSARVAYRGRARRVARRVDDLLDGPEGRQARVLRPASTPEICFA